MIKRIISMSLTSIFISACGNGADVTSKQPNSKPADIVVRATSELNAPSPIIAATYTPNSIATWLGHIIMIGKDGNLYRSNSDGQVSLVDEGKYKSIIGLGRIKQPGLFLSISKNDGLKAFIEADDDGNFKSLPISIDDNTRLTSFCQTVVPSPAIIKALTRDNLVQDFKVIVTDNSSVALNPLSESEPQSSCPALTYNANGVLALDDTQPHLSIGHEGQTKTVSISNGLSIAGMPNPAFVSATTANMGSVFRDGLVLISDEKSGRIVLIARDYFADTVTAPTP